MHTQKYALLYVQKAQNKVYRVLRRKWFNFKKRPDLEKNYVRLSVISFLFACYTDFHLLDGVLQPELLSGQIELHIIFLIEASVTRIFLGIYLRFEYQNKVLVSRSRTIPELYYMN